MFQIGRTHSVKGHNIAAYNTCQKHPNMFGLHFFFVTRTLSKSSIKQKPKSERDREGGRENKENA